MTATSTQLGKAAYAIDNAHTNVEFVVRHLMISKVRGRFGTLSGTIEAAENGFPEAAEVRIDANSIDTREAQRDAHLKSADFFDVEKYPELVFKSRRSEGTPHHFKLYGSLTMHGITREVVLDGAVEGQTMDPWGNQRIAYSATAKISRKDFGLTWNQALETGGVAVGDEIAIEIAIEAIKQ